MEIKRGQLWFADLGEGIGCEQLGMRPVVIVQNDIGNAHSPTTIIAPITCAPKKKTIPTHVRTTYQKDRPYRGTILLEQIRCIDKQRLMYYCGILTHEEQINMEKALSISIGHWIGGSNGT